MLVDTHCHIHDSEFYASHEREAVYARARAADVIMLCVGTDRRSSEEAMEFAKTHEGVYAIVGVHPHEAHEGVGGLRELIMYGANHVVGVGEIGLDYFYKHSAREDQIAVFKSQLAIAQQFRLPVSFHVREAFDDFWPIYDEFSDLHGVLHSFTDNEVNAEAAKSRGLFIGVNGISTFTKQSDQRQLYADLPLDMMVLETDAPYLTPVPYRGKMNEPAFVERVAAHQADLKGLAFDVVARSTTANARLLFKI